ncbi:hypothetical protein H6P81_019218 [Aristolochia fimbriata]|uniref:Asparagine synthetase domain-containing protein n=1 Tax=Aristolochia fimbriata TaxID=158543 RepID=A0AAV7DVT2_ARIFI|nr:hypothetical protein H6P81_019218 [Aristolochia fimbriata]
MCGIALILAGVKIDSSSFGGCSCGIDCHLSSFPTAETNKVQNLGFSVDDLKVTLQRRGPDQLGSKTVFLHSTRTGSVENNEETSISDEHSGVVNNRDAFRFPSAKAKSFAELQFIGAVLQLRGIYPVSQPLVDSSGNHLLFNGEIFGGIDVRTECNDAETLLHALEACCSCENNKHGPTCHTSKTKRISVPELLSAIRGPWALIYFQASSWKIWFGRDAFGRRSLLVHWPTSDDPRILLSSVSPPSSVKQNCDVEDREGMLPQNYWDELSCGIYSIALQSLEEDGIYSEMYIKGVVKTHMWTDSWLKALIDWERTLVEPRFHAVSENNFTNEKRSQMDTSASLENVSDSSLIGEHEITLHAHKVLVALQKSVMKRITVNKIFQPEICKGEEDQLVPVAVLFSGGLDSMILAALLDNCLDSKYEIDLLNVSFDGELAPDRISAKMGMNELRKISPCRRWHLVEIDAYLANLAAVTKHVMSLIHPANTYMDLNIGTALWLAAGGDGWVSEGNLNRLEMDSKRFKYKSKAKVLLVGSGADEQCAGYSRYRTKFKQGSWQALEEEMRLDMQRIWKRNLGRDDRCLSDNGKEARFPFLDEDVIHSILQIPLWEIADLNQPGGRGDKKILREVARLLGLEMAASMPKRAIQFGSRIARESNRRNFGSNRAANLACAGSVPVRESDG